MPSSTTLTTMDTTVPMVGHKRVKPSVYFKPIAQPISNRPATSKISHDMDADIGELLRGRPRHRRADHPTAKARQGRPCSLKDKHSTIGQAILTTGIL